MSEYEQPFLETDEDPLRQFRAWFSEAEAHPEIAMPEAVAVATATADGFPSARMVLMKRADERGLVFFTNYGSRKGGELEQNPRASLLFYWAPLGRQIRVEGDVARVSEEETEAYVRSRPRGSQLSALASPQSRVVESREELERAVEQISERHLEAELPLPEAWGGFRVSPRAWEFWQQRADRLHDRFRYRPDGAGGWLIERLAP